MSYSRIPILTTLTRSTGHLTESGSPCTWEGTIAPHSLDLYPARPGLLTVLTSVDWRGSTNMSFSPDSRYLAYDLPVDDSVTNRDVFVLSVDGSTKVTAVAHESRDVVAGWSPDRRRTAVRERQGGFAGSVGSTNDGRPAARGGGIDPTRSRTVDSESRLHAVGCLCSGRSLARQISTRPSSISRQADPASPPQPLVVELPSSEPTTVVVARWKVSLRAFAIRDRIAPFVDPFAR